MEILKSIVKYILKSRYKRLLIKKYFNSCSSDVFVLPKSYADVQQNVKMIKTFI